MTVLDILSRHRKTEAVFKAWDRRAGDCICCRALFDTVQQVADRYGLNLETLMEELHAAVNRTDVTYRKWKHPFSDLPSKWEKQNGRE